MLCVLIAHNIEWRDTLSISVTEAGRRGGRVTRERYGIKHYQQIGKKGGKTFLEQRGPLFFSAIGTKGGKTRKQQVDPDFYSRIGRLGGSAHATWHRLLPYFQLSSRVIEGKQAGWVELRPFNDRQLNRDLRVVCERVAAAQPHLPDGRRLCLTIAGTGCSQFRWSKSAKWLDSLVLKPGTKAQVSRSTRSGRALAREGQAWG